MACLLQVKAGTIFDNILVTDDEDYAKTFRDETWAKLKDVSGSACLSGALSLSDASAADLEVLYLQIEKEKFDADSKSSESEVKGPRRFFFFVVIFPLCCRSLTSPLPSFLIGW